MTNDPPIILWHSNAPWLDFSYGVQSRIQAPRIAELGYEVIFSAYVGHEGQPILWEGYTVLPRYESRFGDDVLPMYYQQTNADLVITLLDIWAMQARTFEGMNAAHWMPIDSFSAISGIDQLNLDMLTQLHNPKPIAFTHFGEDRLGKAGFAPYYVPHGIDTKLFCPATDSQRKRIRTQLGTDDYFVIGINAANAEAVRKGLSEQLLAFAELRKRHRDCVMLLHTRDQSEVSLDIAMLIRECGELTGHPGDLRDWIWITDQFKYVTQSVPDTEMARWTQGLDVLSMASYGEGFGLPSLEAQACGVPVVTTDADPMRELAPSAFRVPCEPFFHFKYQSWWHRPTIPGIITAYEAAWQAREDGVLAKYGASGRENALKYDADLVVEKYWKPVLAQLIPR